MFSKYLKKTRARTWCYKVNFPMVCACLIRETIIRNERILCLRPSFGYSFTTGRSGYTVCFNNMSKHTGPNRYQPQTHCTNTLYTYIIISLHCYNGWNVYPTHTDTHTLISLCHTPSRSDGRIWWADESWLAARWDKPLNRRSRTITTPSRVVMNSFPWMKWGLPVSCCFI